MYSKNFSFKKGNPYASKDEYQSAQQAQDEEDTRNEEARREFEESADLAWTAGSGQEIRVYRHGNAGEFLVIVDDKEYWNCTMQEVSAKHQAAGIAAKLGPVGLTAERKAALEGGK